MKYIRHDKILYAICEDDIQNEAKYTLGRELTEEELEVAVDGLEWGIGTSISTIYNTIFYEMIPESHKQYEDKDNNDG